MPEEDGLDPTDANSPGSDVPGEIAASNPDSPAPSGFDNTGRTVVGIGASAGGLTALKTLFAQLPADTGLCFVVVMHLSDEHKSHLADLLQFRTNIPVEQATENAEILPNHVYVIPPGYNLSAIDSHLRLAKPDNKRKVRSPIDHFLRTLANSFDGHSIGVILTGTGTDGSLGIREIKAKGGLVIVQDPREAEFDGMPQSAIATGVADLILPLVEIAGALRKIVGTSPRLVVPTDGVEGEAETAPQTHQQHLIQKVFALLHLHTGRDYGQYKSSTSLRRISRRMQLNYINDLPAYLDKLRHQPQELRALADDLLITVTNFFRDSDVFGEIEAQVVPKILEGRGPADPVRIWSVGCATGEEPYSLAMLLLEAATRREKTATIQIFATDIHQGALERARDGFYPGDIQDYVSPERLERFFQKQNEGYRIRKEVRELIVFSQHNLLTDPPFSRLDLICCRNVLIYLQPHIQDEVIEVFHYACRPSGYLVVGPSESVRSTDLFRPLERSSKILQKRNVPGPEPRLPVFPWTKTWSAAGRSEPTGDDVSYRSLHTRLLARYSLPSALVGPNDKAVHLSENAGRYLVHPGGEITHNIVKLVRPEMRAELLVALHTARANHRTVVSKPVAVQFENAAGRVVVSVHPAGQASEVDFLLVTFDDVQQPAPVSQDNGEHALSPPASEPGLESQLQSVIDQYETSQEEMKASNEELQSANEELRSTLEELETSKEELQSMNEELQTVNQENRHKMEELDLLSSDLQNLLGATDIATLFLDRQYRILRFTPKLGDLFNVRMVDRGRPLADITHRLGEIDLHHDAKTVLENLTSIEREVQDAAGKWYLMRVRPYRNLQDRIDGVVVTYVDISSHKRVELALKETAERLARETAVRDQLYDMSTQVGSAKNFTDAADAILTTSIKLLRADFGMVATLDPETGKLNAVARQGLRDDFSLPDDPSGFQAQAVRLRKRVALTDVEAKKVAPGDREAAAEFRFRAAQATPLLGSDSQVLGLLSTYFREPRTLSPADEQIIDLVVRSSSAFLERLHMEETLKGFVTLLEQRIDDRTAESRSKEGELRDLIRQRETDQGAERREIAHVLHDDLQQLLFAAKMLLDPLAENDASAPAKEFSSQVQESKELLKQAIRLTRELTRRFSPANPNLAFGEALQGLAEQMKDTHGLNVEIQASSELSFKEQLGETIYTAVRELLFNVVKHAGVNAAVVEMGRNGDEFTVRVRDQGKGFDVASLDGKASFGLGNARQTLTAKKIKLEFESAPASGTTVTLRGPVALLR